MTQLQPEDQQPAAFDDGYALTTSMTAARETLLQQGADFICHLRTPQDALGFDADMQVQRDIDGQAFSGPAQTGGSRPTDQESQRVPA